MAGWWLRKPFYIKYMIRESSAIFVTIYALILLTGLWRLTQGETAWQVWLNSLQNPLSIGFHVIAIFATLYHAITWFAVSPKVVPHVYLGTNRIPDNLITGVQYVIAAICYAIILMVAIGV